MKIIAIDTSSDITSVALLEDNILKEQMIEETPFSHNKQLFPLLSAVLKETKTSLNDIDYFAVGMGPGSFTGLRIGFSAVKAIAYAQNKKIIPINSLDAVALEGKKDLKESNNLRVLLDGKQNDFFMKDYKFENGKLITIQNLSIIKDLRNLSDVLTIGNMKNEKFNCLPGVENIRYIGYRNPKASYIGLLAFENLDLATNDYTIEPNYYKDFKINKAKIKLKHKK